MKVARINENGRNQIIAALRQYHVNGGAPLDEAKLSRWVISAEAYYEYGNCCRIVIYPESSITRETMGVDITEDGYDLVDAEVN
jgi:hypothetical protein